MKTSLPTHYIPHGGGPCFFMDWDPPGTWEKMGAYLSGFAAAKPKAIVVASAHWEEPAFTVTAKPRPELIYDYYGFPEHTCKIAYPAPGSPELAGEVRELLSGAGLSAAEDTQRGFDHGVFIPLKLMYPEADIPVVQLSLKEGLDPAEHIAAGRALAPLRAKGVLILGSGMSYHNLREFFKGSDTNGGSEKFDTWLTAAATAAPAERDLKLTQWETAPSARACHPREEHLLPLMIAAGAAGPDRGKQTYREQVMTHCVSAYQFG